MSTAIYLALFVFGLAVYFLPGLIAYNRKHKNEGAIVVLNLLLGWTLLGWIIALVWSFTGTQRTDPEEDTTCPDCAETVKKRATKCKHCGRSLTPQL